MKERSETPEADTSPVQTMVRGLPEDATYFWAKEKNEPSNDTPPAYYLLYRAPGDLFYDFAWEDNVDLERFEEIIPARIIQPDGRLFD